jgi:hypothetical protein
MLIKALSLELYYFDFEAFGEGLIAQSRTILPQTRSESVRFSRNALAPSPELYCL